MDLAFSDEQQMLKDEINEFLDRDWSFKILRELEADGSSFDGSGYKQLIEMGLTGIIVPEERNGAGGSWMDAVVAIQELGRMLVPSPLIEMILGEELLLRFASEEDQAQLLPQLAAGEKLVTCALSPGLLTSEIAGSKVILNGSVTQVPYWQEADWLLLVGGGQKERELNLILIDKELLSGAVASPITTIEGRVFHNLQFSGEEYPALAVVPEVDKKKLEAVLARAKILAAADAVGGAQGALNMAIQYARERIQFGRPIGSFQAIQHRLADVAIVLEQARMLTYYAADLAGEGDAAIAEAAMAKLLAGQAFRQAATSGTLVMGGYGYMMEYDMQLYYRRIKQKEFAFNLPQEEEDLIVANKAGLEGNYLGFFV